MQIIVVVGIFTRICRMESRHRHPRESISEFILKECVIASHRINAMQRRIDAFMHKYPIHPVKKPQVQDQVRTISASDLLIHKLRCLAKV